MQPKKNKGKERTKNYPRSQRDDDVDEQLACDMQCATLNSLASNFVCRTSGFGPSQLSYYDDQTVVVSSGDEGLPDSPHESSDEFECTDEEHTSTNLLAPGLPGFCGNGRRHSKVYVVYRGRIPGVYLDWDACLDQVSGYSNNSFKGFNTLEEAQEAWNRSLATRTTPLSGTHLAGSSQTPTRDATRIPRAPASAARLANIKAGLQRQKEVPLPTHDTQQPTPQHRASLSEELQWYAVIEGSHPGVYHGRTAAMHGVGHHAAGCIQIATSENDANTIFIRAFMSRRVVRFE
ncbi:hypothetical protein H0H92_005289 [Tricholoma furcatifolium]|nr:hypothetical protein H0H92_005289 [Tricholoma furcatifolium]